MPAEGPESHHFSIRVVSTGTIQSSARFRPEKPYEPHGNYGMRPPTVEVSPQKGSAAFIANLGIGLSKPLAKDATAESGLASDHLSKANLAVCAEMKLQESICARVATKAT